MAGTAFLAFALEVDFAVVLLELARDEVGRVPVDMEVPGRGRSTIFPLLAVVNARIDPRLLVPASLENDSSPSEPETER